ncbi:hypothetical protein C6P46_003575 [Rhodotorula mucilaginosa]|uniref:HECT-type E3 ubiquitin transferase n=1 Tax=Rhodotorula mucilaginosa TaxID=5537 RepID=A0A9P7B8R4_RHOMI|nr:hypothetical protein C6P46_003575 [Rhodotorula mucilaginosa]
MDSLFLGQARARRQINLGGSSQSQTGGHRDLVQQARHQRLQREQDRARAKAASTIQAFYRGRQSAAQSRNHFQAEYDRLIAVRNNHPSLQDFVTASRLVALGGQYRLGNPHDIKRLAVWCRVALQPPAADTGGPKPIPGRRRPTPLLFAPFATSPSWPVLTRTIARLLLTEATTNVSLAQAPLFLEVVKILADPASYAKYVAPTANIEPTALLRHLVEYGQLYPRVGHALLAIPPEQQRTHPCLSPLLALSLLPLKALLPATPSSSSAVDSSSVILEAFAHSILTIPALLAPAPGGRLTAKQLQQFSSGSGSSDFPLWDLLATLNNNKTGTSSGQQLRTEQTVALLANIVELAKGRLVAAGTATTTTTTGPRPIENGKQLIAYLEVLRTLLGQLPKSVSVLLQDQGAVTSAGAGRGVKGKGKGKGKEEEEVETIVIDDDEDDEDGEDGEDESEEGGASEMDEDDASGGGRSSFNRHRRQRRRAFGGARSSRDQDGDDESMSSAPSSSSSSSRPPPNSVLVVVDPRIRPSLTYLWSREHLLALLSLSTRYSASTRPALCGFLVELLVPPPPHLATNSTGSSRATTTTTTSSSSSSSSSAAINVRDAVLNTLLYSPLSAGLLRELFRGYIRSSELGRTLSSATKREKSAVVLAALKDDRYRDEWPVLVLAVEMYARSLLTMGDDEFYASTSSTAASSNAGRNPLTLDEVVNLSAIIRNATFALYWQDEGTVLSQEGGGGDEKMVDPVLVAQTANKRQQNVVGMGGWLIEDVRGVMTRFLQQVHARDSRRRFTPEGHWHMTSAFDLRSFVETAVFEDERLEAEEDAEPSGGADTPGQAPSPALLRRGLARDTNDSRGPARTSTYSKRQLALISPRLGVLRNIPFVVPFETRVAIFRQFVANDFRKLGLGDATSYSARSRHRAVVRRTNLAEDAYAHLNGLGAELKKRIEIVFIDEHGMEESGIDGGGLFKELLTSLSKEVFDTNRGLWLATSEQELYPNPHGYAKESNQLSWFKFIGRILGKALYQGILVNVKFADFFLAKSYLDDLASLDPELYNGLLKLKTYPGNVEEDLSLNFTITEEDFGVSRSVDLTPHGSEIAVTNDNRMQYIVLVSNYRLNVQIAPQCRAFYSGLFEIINPRWLRMFNQSELAILVGGTEEAIDVEDLRRNTVYSGWSAEENTPTIRYFWDAVSSFSKEERAKLVRFVTACERPPLLGFSQLNPLFAIRNAGTDESRLPTSRVSASACNASRLPGDNSLPFPQL